MLTIIGLVGAKGAGKNTVAKLVREAYPQVREGALADRLKCVCAGFFGINREAFDDPSMKERYIANYFMRYEDTQSPLYISRHNVSCLLDDYKLPIHPEHVENTTGKYIFTPRQLAQYVGTEILRAVDPDVHCKALMEDQPKDGVLIVTDIRFPNELEYFEKLGNCQFLSVYVANFSAEERASKDSHASETGVKDVAAKASYTISNNGSLDDLKEEVTNLLETLKAGSLYGVI